MYINKCANCLMHNWYQVEDVNQLQRCKKCKVIKYCGKQCQSEHWKKVHKKQCRYFTDPVKVQKWGHKEEDCAICIRTAQVGKARIKRGNNQNYECILKEKFPPRQYHPHPFPIGGDPETIFEKMIIVLWQLLKKFELTQPQTIRNCRNEMAKGFETLKMIRLSIWGIRKISPRSLVSFENRDKSQKLLDDFEDEVQRHHFMADPFQLWKIIKLLNQMLFDVTIAEMLLALLNPLADMPTDMHTIMSQGISNSSKFLSKVKQVLDALTTQVIPYHDVLKIICDGSLEKTCSFCSKNIIVANVTFFEEGSTVSFNSLYMEMYRCEGDICREKMADSVRFYAAVMATFCERESVQCDFCFKLPHKKGGHRCSKCLSVMYCSINCRDQDWVIHKEFCTDDVDERKKKFGSSGRRKEARDALDNIEETVEDITLENTEDSVFVRQGVCEVVHKLRQKGAEKKAGK